MTAIPRPNTIAPLLGLLLVFLGMAAPARPPIIVQSPSVPATELPHEITMNKDAGRGNELFVTVRLDNGQKLPFLLDTGASTSVMDKSLVPLLGKCLSRGDVHLF